MQKHVSVSKLEFWLVAAIAFGVLWRIVHLGGREFWYDEVLSLLLSTGQRVAYQDPGNTPVMLADYTPLLRLPVEVSLADIAATLKKLLRGLAIGEPHPPLFFLGQHLWLRLWGNAEAATRSLNAFYGIGAIACSYGLGKLALGQRGGLLLAALLATNPFFMFHSLNVRMYAPLVFWTVLSGWAMLELIHLTAHRGNNQQPSQGKFFAWNLVLIGAVTGGCLTFYLFAYWLIALAVLVFFLDARRWWRYALPVLAGVLVTVPWLMWGFRQQLNNADFDRFSESAGFVGDTLRHLLDLIRLLGIHLVVGDWISTVPFWVAEVAGAIAAIALVGCSFGLWRSGDRQRLFVGVILGVLPLLLALTADVLSGSFTIAFGEGRSLILILPGLLLLLATWIESATQWRTAAAVGMLALFVTVSTADFALRQRQTFHAIANIIATDTPTLVAMNSKAWGHVMRLAYYTPAAAPVSLLATNPVELAPTLASVLQEKGEQYSRIVWLEAARPVWGNPSTEAEARQWGQQVQQVLENNLQLTASEEVSGTMLLDRFSIRVYQPAQAQ